MLRNVKSRVDTSSPRSCARLGSPAMSQSEKTFRKTTTAQDIKKRFKNALHFTKRSKNPPATSTSPNAHFDEINEGAVYAETESCTPPNQMIPRPATRRNPNMCPTVQPFTIRSYASEPPKNLRTQPIFLHQSISKNLSDRHIPQNQHCQHQCVVHAPHARRRNNRVHIEQNTPENFEADDRYEENYSKSRDCIESIDQHNKSRMFFEEIESRHHVDNYTKSKVHMKPSGDMPKSKIHLDQDAKFYKDAHIKEVDSRHSDNYPRNKIRMKPSGDMGKSQVYIEEQEDIYVDKTASNDNEHYTQETHKNNNRCEKCERPPDTRTIHENINNVAKSYTQRSTEEHEYLMFLLRITEDIIVNDFYTNEDIKNIFERHIEENRNRLEYKKMLYHIANLCKELNINCREYCHFEFNALSGSAREPKCLFDRSIFRNCKRCTDLPMTPKFFNSNHNNDGKNHSLNNMRVIEKISLGRVTECTEPMASTSTLNTPKIVEILQVHPEASEHVSRRLQFIEKSFTHQEKEGSYDEEQETPYEKEDNTHDSSTSMEHNRMQNFVVQNFQLNAVDSSENKNNLDFYINVDFQENTSSQENSEDSFKISSKRPKNDFGKLSLDEVWSNTKHLVNQANFEKQIQPSSGYIQRDENSATEKYGRNEEPVSMIEYLDEDVKTDRYNVESQEMNIAQDQSSEYVENQGKIDTNFLQNEYEQAAHIEKNISTILKELSARSSQDYQSNNELVDIFRNSKQKIDSMAPNFDSSKSNCENLIVSSSENVQSDATVFVTQKQDTERNQNEKRECVIKVTIEGNPIESDYVYLKGPIYVLKALLDVQPQLIIVEERNKNENGTSDCLTRHDSAESLVSNKTYTVTNHITSGEIEINVVEQLDMIDVKDIPSSAKNENSVENLQREFEKNVEFLKIPSDTYNLAYSDYDLTPEKEYTDKYHHLLVDAATSISSMSAKKQAKEKLHSNLDLVEENSETNFINFGDTSPRVLDLATKQTSLPREDTTPTSSVVETPTPEVETDVLCEIDNDINVDKNCSFVFDKVLNELKSRFGGADKSLTITTIDSNTNLDANKSVEELNQGMNNDPYTTEDNISNIDMIDLIALSSGTTIVSLSEQMCSDYFIDKLQEINNSNIIELNDDDEHDSVLNMTDRIKDIAICDKTEANSDNENISEESNIEKDIAEEPVIHSEMDQGDVKDNDKLLKNMRAGIAKINQELESELKGKNEIMPIPETSTTDRDVKDRLKSSRSESGRLFRMRDVFQTQRSLSANSDTVCTKQILK